MDNARCLENSQIYSAHEFSRLSASQLARYRVKLQCVGCGNPAFYRKGSTSGQGACFGARPHRPNCKYLVAEEVKDRISGVGSEAILENNGERIVVDLMFGSTALRHQSVEAAAEPASARRGRFVGPEKRRAAMKRRLSSLLDTLIVNPAFCNSAQVLELKGHASIPVSEFFVPLLSVQQQHMGLYRGYWGVVVDAKLSPDSKVLWLNSGGKHDMSLCIPSSFVERLLERFRFSEVDDINGAYALVLGRSQRSKGLGAKVYLKISDIGEITMRRCGTGQ